MNEFHFVISLHSTQYDTMYTKLNVLQIICLLGCSSGQQELSQVDWTDTQPTILTLFLFKSFCTASFTLLFYFCCLCDKLRTILVIQKSIRSSLRTFRETTKLLQNYNSQYRTIRHATVCLLTQCLRVRIRRVCHLDTAVATCTAFELVATTSQGRGSFAHCHIGIANAHEIMFGGCGRYITRRHVQKTSRGEGVIGRGDRSLVENGLWRIGTTSVGKIGRRWCFCREWCSIWWRRHRTVITWVHLKLWKSEHASTPLNK